MGSLGKIVKQFSTGTAFYGQVLHMERLSWWSGRSSEAENGNLREGMRTWS